MKRILLAAIALIFLEACVSQSPAPIRDALVDQRTEGICATEEWCPLEIEWRVKLEKLKNSKLTSGQKDAALLYFVPDDGKSYSRNFPRMLGDVHVAEGTEMKTVLSLEGKIGSVPGKIRIEVPKYMRGV